MLFREALSPFLSNTVLGNVVSVIRYGNDTFIGKKEGKMSSFADNLIVYMQIQGGL